MSPPFASQTPLWGAILMLASCSQNAAHVGAEDAGPLGDAAPAEDAAAVGDAPAEDAATVSDAPATEDSPVGDAVTDAGARLALLDYNVQARPVLDTSRAIVNLPIIGGKLAPLC